MNRLLIFLLSTFFFIAVNADEMPSLNCYATDNSDLLIASKINSGSEDVLIQVNDRRNFQAYEANLEVEPSGFGTNLGHYHYHFGQGGVLSVVEPKGPSSYYEVESFLAFYKRDLLKPLISLICYNSRQ